MGRLKKILTSERLYLRELTLKDIPFLQVLYKDPRVMKFVRDGKPVTDRKALSKELQQRIIYYSENKGLGVWPAFEKKGSTFIGWFGLKYLDTTPQIEVGYRLLHKFWGLGYVTEMTQSLINYGFGSLKLERIVAVTHPENSASKRVLEKSGMIREGFAFHYGIKVD